MKKATSGFTIVELLIVIVVIGILAAITVVAYNGIQIRARDNIRKSDIAVLVKAIELFRTDYGEAPPANTGPGWCTQISNPAFTQTSDALRPYLGNKNLVDPVFANTYRDYFYRKDSLNGYTVAAELDESDLTDDAISNSCTRIGGTANEYDYVITR